MPFDATFADVIAAIIAAMFASVVLYIFHTEMRDWNDNLQSEIDNLLLGKESVEDDPEDEDVSRMKGDRFDTQ